MKVMKARKVRILFKGLTRLMLKWRTEHAGRLVELESARKTHTDILESNTESISLINDRLGELEVAQESRIAKPSAATEYYGGDNIHGNIQMRTVADKLPNVVVHIPMTAEQARDVADGKEISISLEQQRQGKVLVQPPPTPEPDRRDADGKVWIKNRYLPFGLVGWRKVQDVDQDHPKRWSPEFAAELNERKFHYGADDVDLDALAEAMHWAHKDFSVTHYDTLPADRKAAMVETAKFSVEMVRNNPDWDQTKQITRLRSAHWKARGHKTIEDDEDPPLREMGIWCDVLKAVIKHLEESNEKAG